MRTKIPGLLLGSSVAPCEPSTAAATPAAVSGNIDLRVSFITFPSIPAQRAQAGVLQPAAQVRDPAQGCRRLRPSDAAQSPSVAARPRRHVSTDRISL